MRVTIPSGRESLLLELLIIEIGHRLEAVIAHPAMPEIGDAARRGGFDPVRCGNRMSALGTGIFAGQRTEVRSRHHASPFGGFCFLKVNETGLLPDASARPAINYSKGALSLLNGKPSFARIVGWAERLCPPYENGTYFALGST